MGKDHEKRARARLLIAEDNPINLDIGTRILEGLGYAVATVDNGSAAVEILGREKFDAVLMDCEMPDMGGIQATALVRNAEGSRLASDQVIPRVPIIALTAYSSDEIREKCLAAGMDDFIQKPLTKNKLRETLSRWIGEPLSQPAGVITQASHSTGGMHTPSLDESVLTSLIAARPGDAAHYLTRLVQRFEEIAPNQVSRLWQSYREGQPDSVWKIAHTLRSNAGALGACALAARAAAVERHAKERGLLGLEPLLASLDEDLSHALRSLSVFVGEIDGTGTP